MLAEATGLPLVLHGGSGIQQEYVLGAVKRGIAKINVGTEIRQPYETIMRETGDVAAAQQVVYDRTRWLIREFFGIAGTPCCSSPEAPVWTGFTGFTGSGWVRILASWQPISRKPGIPNVSA